MGGLAGRIKNVLYPSHRGVGEKKKNHIRGDHGGEFGGVGVKKSKAKTDRCVVRGWSEKMGRANNLWGSCWEFGKTKSP